MALLAAMTIACRTAIAGEDSDFGVAPARELRLLEYAAPTPLQLPGAKTLRTPQLQTLLEGDIPLRPLLFDVVGGDGHDSIPGAIWLPGAGRGESFNDAVQTLLARTLEELTGRARARPVVFFCTGPHCWLSYNAALRAVALGYSEVYWYRGGIEAWVDAGRDLQPMRLRWSRPPE